jgi:hypothetical protein
MLVSLSPVLSLFVEVARFISLFDILLDFFLFLLGSLGGFVRDDIGCVVTLLLLCSEAKISSYGPKKLTYGGYPSHLRSWGWSSTSR